MTGYLRSWAFEAQLRDFLRSEFGNDWFARREAGDLLRELWALGQGPTAEELLQDVTGAHAADGLRRRPHPREPREALQNETGRPRAAPSREGMASSS